MGVIEDLEYADREHERPEAVDAFISYMWYEKFSEDQQQQAMGNSTTVAGDILGLFSKQEIEEEYAKSKIESPPFNRMMQKDRKG